MVPWPSAWYHGPSCGPSCGTTGQSARAYPGVTRHARTAGLGGGSAATGGVTAFGDGCLISTLIGFGSGGWAMLGFGPVAIGLWTGGGAGVDLTAFDAFEPVALSLSTW